MGDQLMQARFKTLCGAVLTATLLGFAARAQTTVTDDNFEPRVAIEGPLMVLRFPDGDTVSMHFRTWVDKRTRIATHQLYIDSVYDSPHQHLYDDAYDDRTTQHQLTRILHHSERCVAGDCEHEEIFGLGISDDQMRDYAGSGVKFKVKAQDGDDLQLTLSRGAIITELQAVSPYAAQPYALDLTLAPPPPIGANLEDEGVFNRMLYSHLDQGLHVGKVESGSPLDKAGVQRYDWLWELNGVALKRDADLKTAMDGVHLGSRVKARIRRGDQFLDVVLPF